MSVRTIRDVRTMASRFAEDLANELESWKPDHDDAMRCHDLQDALTVINGILQWLIRRESHHQALVLSGECHSNSDADRQILRILSTINRSCTTILAAIETYEEKGDTVSGARDFRVRRKKIRNFFFEMRRREQAARRVGLLGVVPDAEAMGLLDRMMNDPTYQSPRSSQGPLSAPTIDPSRVVRSHD